MFFPLSKSLYYEVTLLHASFCFLLPFQDGYQGNAQNNPRIQVLEITEFISLGPNVELNTCSPKTSTLDFCKIKTEIITKCADIHS
jgi:hypothetical protein